MTHTSERDTSEYLDLRLQLSAAEESLSAVKNLLEALHQRLGLPLPAPHLEASTPPQDRLIPLTEWPRIHPWPKLGGLRHYVHMAAFNGFDRVIVRVGGRILIQEQAFFAWARTNPKVCLPGRRSGSRTSSPTRTRRSPGHRH